MIEVIDESGSAGTGRFYSLIQKIAEETVASERFPGDVELTVLLTNNESIAKLNQKYRGINRPTDVLSFNMEQLAPGDYAGIGAGETFLLGDIVISYEKAVQQAADYGHSLEREIAFLTAHGTLHLLGYDHELEKDRALMFEKQDKILVHAGISR